MTQTTGIRKHHMPSPECQAPGVAFVLGVSAILDDRWAPTEYGTFYKKCADRSGRHLDQTPKEFIENEMLCALMCCCANHPAHGSAKKNLHQMCVKDILDGANDVFKKKGIPATRFLAEPALDDQRLDFSRGRMNPSGMPKMLNARRDFPDVAILEKPSQGPLFIKNVTRFVEMKFKTEVQNGLAHQEQTDRYLTYKKPVTTMYQSFGLSTLAGNSPVKNDWFCGCTGNDDEKQLEKDANVLDPRAEFEKHRKMFWEAFGFIPGTGAAKVLKGLGALGKAGKLVPIPGM